MPPPMTTGVPESRPLEAAASSLALPTTTVDSTMSGSLLLRRKMRIAGLFFVFSLATAVLSFAVSDLPTWVRALDVFLLANCLLCAVGPGEIGTRLILAIFPG